MRWLPLPDEPDALGVLELEPPPEGPALELQLRMIGYLTVALWLTDRGDLLAVWKPAEA